MSDTGYTSLDPAVNIVSCLYDEDMTRIIKEDISHNHEYTLVWRVLVNETDLDGHEVLRQVRALREIDFHHPQFDRPPKVRDTYYPSFSSEDRSSFCYSVHCELIKIDDPTQFRITAEYAPPKEEQSSVVWDHPLPSDPLQWYWTPEGFWSVTTEFLEDQVVVENAICLSDLKQIQRGPRYDDPDAEINSEPGPIVNAAGQQTIDPQVETTHRLIFNVKVNYPNQNYALALNNYFERGVHAPSSLFSDQSVNWDTTIFYNTVEIHQWDEDPVTGLELFMGYPHGTWKFLIAEPMPIEYRVLADETIISFCPTIIKLELKFGDVIRPFSGDNPTIYAGWVRQILNNGQTCFKKWNDNYLGIGDLVYIRDPNHHEAIQLFPTEAKQLKDEATDSDGNPIDGPDLRGDHPGSDRTLESSQLEKVETSEPVNLKRDGTQITDPTIQPNHILYTSLRAVNLYDITDAYGRRIFPSSLSMPTFPIDPTTPPEEDTL